MTEIYHHFSIDGQRSTFEPGQTILQAALAAGIYIPHLCAHPEFTPHGRCKLCTVTVNGRTGSACTIAAMPGQEVRERHAGTERDRAASLLQMLFVEGNHFCPGCEKSGNCQLQALGLRTRNVQRRISRISSPTARSTPRIPTSSSISTAASCASSACAPAATSTARTSSRSPGAGATRISVVNSPIGQARRQRLSPSTDKAAQVCPVGAILPKRVGFAVADRRAPLRP